MSVITIVDDDSAVRDSLEMLLDLHGLSVRSFESGDAFLNSDLLAVSGPVLLDVRMPGRDGLTVLPLALAENPALNIVMMSGHADIAMAVEALRRGAVDFIEKPFHAGDVLGKLDALRSSSPADMSPDDNAHANGTAAAKALVNSLTPRERDVMAGLVAGKPNKIMAGDLGISVRTIESHRAKLMLKLGARSLSDVVKIALQAGMA